jgi:hypothetical protein
MFALSLRSVDHVRRYSVTFTPPAGWEVRLEEDRLPRRIDHYRDWHRVERALARVEREVNELMASGWQMVATDAARDERR